jgi:LytS/YehU family sensor histidine kinase
MKLPKPLLLPVTGLLVGFVFYTYIFYSEMGTMPGYLENRETFLLTLASFVCIAAGVYLTGQWLNKRLPWQQMITMRLLSGIFLNTLLSLLIVWLSVSLYVSLLSGKGTMSGFLATYLDGALKTGILIFLAVFIYTIIDFTLYSYKQFARQQIASVKLTQTQLTLQLQILRNQLSPHFLFNSMNTISALIYQDKERAEDFIRKLAHTYQYILTTHDKPLVTLAEEVEFLGAYIFLLESRFEGALDIQLSLPDHVMKSKIPPLTLQLLVENAVKHNLVTKENPLMIKLYVDMYDQITVKNTIQEKTGQNDSFKIGLDNIKGRYQYLTNKQIQVLKDSYFTVKLPLLNA